MTTPTITLNDSTTLPAIGFGTYQLLGAEGADATVSALESGYRLIDTALNYENEGQVGEAILRGGIAREELRIVTKLPGRFHGYDETLAGFDESLQNLGLDYLDLFLIHWPMPRVDKYVDTWKAMIELRERGVVRSIGVCNFTQEYLDRIIGETGVVPSVNQVELHPHFPQAALRAIHADHGIQTMSWSPLAHQRELLSDTTITSIAQSHGVTPAQAALRWHVQLGTIPIPKSATPSRQVENLDVFSFELTGTEMASISSLESGRLWGGDLATNEEF